MKECLYCKQSKPFDEFPRHTHSKDNLDSRCKVCKKAHGDRRNELRKAAGPKPEVCECCGKVPEKWCLDHDHIDGSFRGWLCQTCNLGLGHLGDDIDGIVKALNYLLSKRKKIVELEWNTNEEDAIMIGARPTNPRIFYTTAEVTITPPASLEHILPIGEIVCHSYDGSMNSGDLPSGEQPELTT